MSGSAEGDALLRNVRVGDDVIVLSNDLVDIDQICWGGGLTRIVATMLPILPRFFATLGTIMLRVVNFCANRVPVV